MRRLSIHPVLLYLLKFCCIFCIFYFGTLLIIGLSSKENVYSPFVANYLDYVTLLRNLILNCSNFLLQKFNYSTVWDDQFTLGIEGGKSVRVVYSCVGYGVMSFWSAFILANDGSAKRKASWFFGGFTMLLMLNILRIFLLILAINAKSSFSIQIDHHVIFNVVAYGLIFLLIYLYDRSKKHHLQLDPQL
ncbi:MAG: exosortase/archaeosortase family protein [Flavobacterium sp.]|nr:MAG: exosortase/archaeosortase family protein [Flavobacterium sp.]